MPRNSPRPNLIPYRFQPDNEQPFAKKQLQIRLPLDLKEALDSIPAKQRNELIRKWIADGYSKYQKNLAQDSNFEQKFV